MRFRFKADFVFDAEDMDQAMHLLLLHFASVNAEASGLNVMDPLQFKGSIAIDPE